MSVSKQWIYLVNTNLVTKDKKEFFSYFTEAKIGESVQIQLYDRNLKVSDTEMRKMLNKADLRRQGYTKEIDFKIVKEPDKPGYRQACQLMNYALSFNHSTFGNY